jgi:hexosaminidase
MVATAAALAAATRYAIIPQPVVLIPQEGEFELSQTTPIVAPKELANVASFAKDLVASTRSTATSGNASIRFKLNKSQPRIGNEGYTLDVSPDSIEISARTPAGAFYGVQTLRQLVQNGKVPSVIIEDTPRFGWRGAMLDTGRHYMPMAAIKKFIDTLAFHKMNSFHWHLTEDQGWRLEIKKYPKLTEIGSKRSKSMLKYSPATYEDKEYGGFYTQAEAKEIAKKQ